MITSFQTDKTFTNYHEIIVPKPVNFEYVEIVMEYNWQAICINKFFSSLNVWVTLDALFCIISFHIYSILIVFQLLINKKSFFFKVLFCFKTNIFTWAYLLQKRERKKNKIPQQQYWCTLYSGAFRGLVHCDSHCEPAHRFILQINKNKLYIEVLFLLHIFEFHFLFSSQL